MALFFSFVDNIIVYFPENASLLIINIIAFFRGMDFSGKFSSFFFLLKGWVKVNIEYRVICFFIY